MRRWLELGINVNTLHGWIQRYREQPDCPFPASGRLSPEDDRLRKMERENRDLREEVKILKKSGGVLRKEPEIKRFRFIRTYRCMFRVAKMCKVLGVSRSGYNAWEKRPKSVRRLENEELSILIREIHKKHRAVYGSRKVRKELERLGKRVNHKRVERVMKKEGLRSRVAKKFKATTNSSHTLPVAENILNREFTAEKAGQKMVSDIITYLWTDEGWLYIAGVLDLYDHKVVGLSMGEL